MIETRIQGIPCQVRVTRYIPGDSGRRTGHPDTWTPPEGAEIEYEVLDRRGRPAPWLQSKMTDADDDAVCELISDRSVGGW